MSTKLVTWAMLLVAGLGLFACAGQPQAPAKIDVKVPWPDREATYYVIRDKQDKQVGTADLQVTREGDAYVVSQLYDLSGAKDSITMHLKATDLKPISGHREITSQAGMITIDTAYKDGKLSISAKTAEGPRSAEIDVPADAYDNDEALFFWRSLPFAEGYKLTYTNVVSANALKPAVTLTVLGKEKVAVPAGDLEAWKVEMSTGQQKQYVWFEVAPPVRLVKYENGATVFLLSNKQ